MDCRLTVKDKAPAIFRRKAPSRRSRACQGTKRKGRRSVRMRTSASRYNARHFNSRSIFREPTEEPLFGYTRKDVIFWHDLYLSPGPAVLSLSDYPGIPPMMVPTKAVVGRRVIFRRIGGPPLVGTVSNVGARRVFVRFERRSYSLAVSPADLELWVPPQASQTERQSFGPDRLLQL